MWGARARGPYAALERKRILTRATCANLEDRILSEESQAQKIQVLTHNTQRIKTMEPESGEGAAGAGSRRKSCLSGRLRFREIFKKRPEQCKCPLHGWVYTAKGLGW